MALEVNNLGFYYKKDNWLFRNINFKLNRGEILGIFGYSGCGKTTLAQVLSDYHKPKEGEIIIDGEMHKKGTFKTVQLIHQHPEKVMNPNWKMEDILKESYEPDKEIKELFGIRDEWLTRFPIELSGGELQRFSIVRALHPETKYIIADEMTTMLDSITQANIWKQLITFIKEKSLGLIIISHERDIIKKLCDKAYYMDKDY